MLNRARINRLGEEELKNLIAKVFAERFMLTVTMKNGDPNCEIMKTKIRSLERLQNFASDRLGTIQRLRRLV